MCLVTLGGLAIGVGATLAWLLVRQRQADQDLALLFEAVTLLCLVHRLPPPNPPAPDESELRG